MRHTHVSPGSHECGESGRAKGRVQAFSFVAFEVQVYDVVRCLLVLSVVVLSVVVGLVVVVVVAFCPGIGRSAKRVSYRTCCVDRKRDRPRSGELFCFSPPTMARRPSGALSKASILHTEYFEARHFSCRHREEAYVMTRVTGRTYVRRGAGRELKFLTHAASRLRRPTLRIATDPTKRV